MAGPLQGPAAAASGAGGTGSLDRTPYSTGRGTGGKARSSRPARNQHGAVGVASSGVGAAATTRRGPYDRPAAGRHASAGPQAAARRSGRVGPGAWIGAGAVGSAASRILSGASSFLSSFFRKNSQNLALPALPLTAPLEDGTTQSFQDGYANDCSVLVHVEEKAVEDVDIEDILQERVFSREECDHFIKLLQSKLHNNTQSGNRIANGLKEDRDRRLYPDDELQRERERHGPGLAEMPIDEAVLDHGGSGSSPVDIAKAYMDKRLSPMPGSALPVRTLDYWDAVRGREEVRATPSRVRLEATPGRTPYLRQRQPRPYDEGVRPSPYPVRGTGGREKKRRVDDDWDYSGRRTRRKTSAANGPPVSTLPAATNDLSNGGYFERMKNLQKARLERSHKPDTTVHVPMQSTETARKILQTLEILTPPKGKTLEQELALVREMRPKELSPSMLNEQARKSMQVVECPVVQTSTEPCSHVAEPSSSQGLFTSSRQPMTNDTKGKGVSPCLEGGLSAFEHHAGTSQSTLSKGFRMNAAMEDSNSDDEGHPQTLPPLSTVTSTAVRVDAISVTKVDISSAPSLLTTGNNGSASEPVSLSSKFGFTFPSAGGLFEPPTPKPIPSPMAQTGVDSALATRAIPTMQQNSTTNDASKTETQPSVQQVPAAFSKPPSSSEEAVSSHSDGKCVLSAQSPPVQSGSFPDFSASNGSSTTSHGSSVVAATSTSQTKAVFVFETNQATDEVERISKKRSSNVDDGNIVQSSEPASGSIFGISRSTSSVPIDTNLGPSNGTFHLPGGEAGKFGFGNSISVPSSSSAPFSSSPLGTSSSVGRDVGNAAQANGGSSNPAFGGLPLSGNSASNDKLSVAPAFPSFGTASGSSTGFSFGSTPFGTSSVAEFPVGEIKPAFTFGSTSSTSVTESKPTISFGGTSSTTATESKPAFPFGGTSSTSATDSKPAFPFGATSSTSATESKPAFPFGATSGSSVPESKPAFTFGSMPAAESKPAFPFGATSSASAISAEETKPIFPFGATSSTSFSFGASVSSTAASMFGTPSSSTFGTPASSASGSTSGFAFSASTSQTAAPFSFTSSASAVAPFSFPATTSASMAPFSFGQPAVSSSFPSASFSFGASTPSTSGSVFSAATGSSFGSGAINPFPVFNSSPGFGSTNGVSTSDMNEHSMEDMAEEPAQVMQPPPSQPPPMFGNSAAQPFVFGGQSPAAAPAFGSSQPAVGSQPANPFSGFSAGSFAVGSGGAGGEKAGRKFIKAKRTGAAKRGK